MGEIDSIIATAIRRRSAEGGRGPAR